MNVTLGDNTAARGPISVNAEGGAVELSGTTTTTASGSFKHASFPITVSDGSLTLELSGNFSINALDIRQTQGNLSITGPGSVQGDGNSTDTFTGTGATPGALVTVTASLGNVTGVDASAPFFGQQVTALGNGTFTFTVQRPSGAVVSTITAEETTGALRGAFTQTYALAPVVSGFRFDFNDGVGPTQAGYIGVNASTLYGGPGTPNYGWTNTLGIGSADRGLTTPTGNTAQTNLLTDFNYGQFNWGGDEEANARTFHTSGLTPNTTYVLTATLGDAVIERNDIQISAGGNATPPVVVADVDVASGQFRHVTFTATSSADGDLYVKFKRTTLYGVWVVNGLEMRPTQNPISLGNAGVPLAADGTTLDTFTGSGASANAFVTITNSLGSVAGNDTHVRYAGIQVQADANGNFSYVMRRPGASGTATFTAEEVNGASLGTTTQVYNGIAAVRRFDFNTAGSATAAGFTPVLASTNYSSATGYGWDASGIYDFDRGAASPSPLRGDGHYAVGTSGRVFTIAVNPGTQYNVRVYSGDQSLARYTILSVDGNGTTVSQYTPAGGFMTPVFTTSGNATLDGTITITASSLVAGSEWVINGIDIWETSSCRSRRPSAAGRQHHLRHGHGFGPVERRLGSDRARGHQPLDGHRHQFGAGRRARRRERERHESDGWRAWCSHSRPGADRRRRPRQRLVRRSDPE